MTAIDPLTGGASPLTGTATRQANDQFGKDTFLKLLVAQLKYQNPLAPKDGSEFLAQTAQFTMVEKLTAIESQLKTSTAANEVLQASTMIGKSVTAALRNGGEPTVSTRMQIGGNLPSDAAVGAVHEINTTAYTSTGQMVPLRLEFTKLPATEGTNAWQLRTWSGTQMLGEAQQIQFGANGQCTTTGPTISMADLERVPGTTGAWGPAGLQLGFGSATDVGRLRSTQGNVSVAVREQDGSDGSNVTGIVSGVKFTIDGPLLRIGTREIPMGDVVEVHVPPS